MRKKRKKNMEEEVEIIKIQENVEDDEKELMDLYFNSDDDVKEIKKGQDEKQKRTGKRNYCN